MNPKNLHSISFHRTAVHIFLPIHFHQLHPEMMSFLAKNRKMSKGAVLRNWCSDLDTNKIQIYQQIKIFFNPSIVHKSYASIAQWNNNILFPMQARGLMGLQLDRWGANVFLLFIFSDFLVIYSHGPKDAKDEVKQARRITALGLGPRLVNLYVHISNISNPNS